MEQPPDQEPLNIMVLTKEFDPDLEELGKDFTSEENKAKRAGLRRYLPPFPNLLRKDLTSLKNAVSAASVAISEEVVRKNPPT